MVNNNKINNPGRATSLSKNRYTFYIKNKFNMPQPDPYGAYLYMYNIYVCNTHIQIVRNHK